MKEKRYYYDGELSVNQTIFLEGDEFHHLANVMRARLGEIVCIFNGNGKFYFGEVKEISKKFASIIIEREEISSNEPTIDFTLFQAMAKGDKLSLIMQKITELGASNLVLFDSKFCDVKANTNKQERMDTVSISASKQCGRATIVGSEGVLNIKEVASRIPDFYKFYVAYENEDGKTLTTSLLQNLDAKKVAVMIGAEGGFSEEEIELLKNSGAEIVSLGSRILRTETAAITCTALVLQILEKK